MSKNSNNWKDKAWFGLLLLDEVPVSYRFKPQDKVLPPRLEFESLEKGQANSLTDTGYRNEFFPNIAADTSIKSATDLVQQYLQARIPKAKVVLIARTTEEQKADEVLKGVEELYLRLDRGKEAADARSRIGKPLPQYFDLAGYERLAKATERQVNIAKGKQNAAYDFPKTDYAKFESIVMSGRKRTIELSENKRVLKAMQTGHTMYNQLLSLIGKYGWQESDLRHARGMAMADIPAVLGTITGSLQRILSQEQAEEKGYKRADKSKRETAYKSFYDNISKAKKVYQTAIEELAKKKSEKATQKAAKGEWVGEDKAEVLELRAGVEVKVGMFLRRPEEPFFIEILKIEEKDYRNIGKRTLLTYRNHMLSTISTYESEGVYWENFQKNNRAAEVLTKAESKKLWEEAMQALPDEEQTALIENIKKLIKNENLQTAEFELQDYFRKVVLREPEKIKTFFHLRNAIPNKKFRPCLCTEDLREDVRKAFYERLEDNLFAYIPKDSLVKLRKLTDRSGYEADPDDKHLKDLIKPFVSKDQLRPAMWGVNFSDKGTAMTDAHRLLLLPKVKTGKKGTYCMTRKCFKDNDFQAEIDSRYPDYAAILPQPEDEYQCFILDVQQIRYFIKTLENNGIVGSSRIVRFNFVYGADEYLRFNATKILLPMVETLGKLGHEKVKMWVTKHNAAVVFTGIDSTRKDIGTAFQKELLLGMPLFAGDNRAEFEESTELGDLMIDLDAGKTWFNGAEGKTIAFEVEIDKTESKTANKKQVKSTKSKEEELAKAKLLKIKMAQMQDQEIRVLEMEMEKEAA